MKNAVLYLLLFLATCPAFAGSVITKSYHQRPLSEVLRDIDKATPDLEIRFIYNKLEDYTVTTSIRNATPLEAIRQAIGFYPVSVKQEENTIIVEPVFDTEQKLIGRIVDEKGHPLEFANVRLFSPSDNSLITGGVTNKNGDFVIPCSPGRFTVNVSYVGYETLVRSIEMPASGKSRNVGTWAMAVGKNTLRSVVVEGDLATTSAEKSTYIPTRRQRNAATDATALLAHMMIPQLRVNPASGYVTTLSGEPVTIFIDYLPATQEDLEGMNTQDVRRVEIFDYPSDVRFQGKAHVVNFVMQRNEVGGYTKLTTKHSVLADYSATNSVYSKLSHKNWTFDANVTSKFSDKKQLGSETTETFNLPTQTITRTETFKNGKLRNSETSYSFRATYNTEKIQIENRIALLDNNTPKEEKYGNVLYNPNIFSSQNSVARQDSRYLTPTYEGEWFFSLPKNWTLKISPDFQYSHNKLNRFCQEGESAAIVNDVTEETHQADWWIYFGKQLGKHKINFGNYGLTYGSRMDYTGSTTTHQTMDFLAIGIPFKYFYQSEKLKISALLTALYQRNKVNGEAKSEWSPTIIATADYAFNPKNKLQATFRLNRAVADGAMRNPSVIQSNEILYYNGNPQLDNYSFYLANLQYTWMPSNTFSASAFVEHTYDKNYYANIWQPYLDGKILQTRDNVGDLHTTKIGASLTLRLLDGNLQFNANPSLRIYKTTGEYNEKGSPFSCDLDASYYFGDFYLNAGYESPYKTYKYSNALWRRSRSYYYLSAGWGNANWKAKLYIINPFRTDWRDIRSTITTPIYSQISETFNSSSHQRLNLTLTYIFNYGKKVKRGDELGTASGGQSSIL